MRLPLLGFIVLVAAGDQSSDRDALEPDFLEGDCSS